MKFIAKSVLILSVIALCLGAVTYGVLSSNVKQSGTISLAQHNQDSQSRTVTNEVEQIEMNGPFDLVIVRGDKAALLIEGEERLVPKVIVQQDGKVLRIGTTGMLVTMNQTVKVTLTIPKLTSITQGGSGDCDADGFSGPEISLVSNGSGSLTFNGNYQHVIVQSKGSGNVELDLGNFDRADLVSGGAGSVEAIGKANKLNAILTGAGTLDAERLIAQEAEAVSSGAGNMTVYASKQAKVIASGSGNVEIYGNPEQKTVTKTGAGEVSSN